MKSLIFIPDISGYTRFITSTETNHSRHIIKELIEVILLSNKYGLIVSEIEGDAVLFYKQEAHPDPDILVQQAEEMFIAFHTHLKIIERDNICICGACRTASGLSLKFIVHYGEIEEITILNHSKIMGGDVILAHRLLKNSVPHSEYILFTSAVLESAGAAFNRTNDLLDHSEQYENFREINAKYLPLSYLKTNISVPESPRVAAVKREGGFSLSINAPRDFVYEILLNDSNKLKWVSGLVDVKSDSPLPLTGKGHICVFEDVEMSFTNLSAQKNDREIIFMQKGNIGRINFIQQFVLSGNEKSAIITSKMFPAPNEEKQNMLRALLHKITSYIMIYYMNRSSRKDFKKLRDYCESVYESRNS